MCGGRPHWGPRRRPLGGLAVTRLNPPFVPLRGWGCGGAERRESGLRAGRPDVACDGLGGRETGRDPRRPGERRRRRGRGSGLSLRGRPAAGGLLSQRPRARCESGSPAPAPGSVGGGQEGGKGREKICSLSWQVSRRLREREGERCFQSSGSTCFPHARLAEVRFGACVKERASLFIVSNGGGLSPKGSSAPPPGLRLRTVVCVCYQIRRDIDFPRRRRLG